MPDGRRTNYTECDTDAITEWRRKERLVLEGPAKDGKINNRNAAREKAETMTLTVYTKPACVQCNAVFRTLDRLGTKYRRVDISTDSEAREFVMAMGYLQAPVVYAGPDNHHSGFRPDRLKALAAAVA
jgi:glutaredoxin-like protein NrdH